VVLLGIEQRGINSVAPSCGWVVGMNLRLRRGWGRSVGNGRDDGGAEFGRKWFRCRRLGGYCRLGTEQLRCHRFRSGSFGCGGFGCGGSGSRGSGSGRNGRGFRSDDGGTGGREVDFRGRRGVADYGWIEGALVRGWRWRGRDRRGRRGRLLGLCSFRDLGGRRIRQGSWRRDDGSGSRTRGELGRPILLRCWCRVHRHLKRASSTRTSAAARARMSEEALVAEGAIHASASVLNRAGSRRDLEAQGFNGRAWDGVGMTEVA
jgi:hypothetical protein